MLIDCTGIPDHLHQNDREAIQDFAPEEWLFRRFSIHGNKYDWDPEEIKNSSSVIQFRSDSYNRERFCMHPTDVYHSAAPTPFEKIEQVSGTFGIQHHHMVNAETRKVTKIDNQECVMEVLMVHDPEACNYAHCELVILKDSVRYDGKKPHAEKNQIRQYLMKNIHIFDPQNDTVDSQDN